MLGAGSTRYDFGRLQPVNQRRYSISMTGFNRRSMTGKGSVGYGLIQTGLPWINPSPNLRQPGMPLLSIPAVAQA